MQSKLRLEKKYINFQYLIFYFKNNPVPYPLPPPQVSQLLHHYLRDGENNYLMKALKYGLTGWTFLPQCLLLWQKMGSTDIYLASICLPSCQSSPRQIVAFVEIWDQSCVHTHTKKKAEESVAVEMRNIFFGDLFSLTLQPSVTPRRSQIATLGLAIFGYSIT